jgi:hypothetical protein
MFGDSGSTMFVGGDVGLCGQWRSLFDADQGIDADISN